LLHFFKLISIVKRLHITNYNLSCQQIAKKDFEIRWVALKS